MWQFIERTGGPLAWFIGGCVLPYFVLRGWLNTGAVLLGLYCLVAITVRRRPTAVALQDRRLGWMVVALSTPLLAAAAVQLLHQEFVPRYLDSPGRLWLGALILLHLVERRVNVLPVLGLALPASVLLAPGAHAYFWDGAQDGPRAATYFIDPLTLATHAAIAGFASLFLMDAEGRDATWQRALKAAGFAVAMAVSFATQSRTGWLMMPVLAAIWLIGHQRAAGPQRIALALASVVLASALLYFGVDVVRERVDGGVRDIVQYLNGGDRDTSLGIRMRLWHAHWTLFLEKPLAGWGFGSLPTPSATPSIASLSTPMFEMYFLGSGAHNEVLQNMMRMGTLGLLSRLMVFLVPLAFFARATRSAQPRERTAGYAGLAVVIGFLSASLTSEVLNLVYAAAFYGLLVAAFAAAVFVRPAR